ncbi:unnamed protein product [Pylaiella littoralis]
MYLWKAGRKIQRRVCMLRAGAVLAGAAFLACCLSNASAQEEVSATTSCVQVVDVVDDFSAGGQSNCRACGQIGFSFSVEGTTTVETNTVNLALVVDGSGSISPDDWELEKVFAKDVVAAFTERNLFENGGKASYVQFSSYVYSSGSFTSQEDFDEFVDADFQSSGGTDISEGVAEGQRLLSLNNTVASGAIMIVITDGASYIITAELEADAARAAGTNIFAVGVGEYVDEETLVAVAGSEDNVFDTDSFAELDLALEELLNTDALISCNSSDATIAVEFTLPIESVAYPGAVISGNTVTFEVENLEANPTEFAAVLDVCSIAEGTTNAVASITYSDAQNNTPDLSIAQEAADLGGCEAGESGRSAAGTVSVIAAVGAFVTIIGGMFRGLPSANICGKANPAPPGDLGPPVREALPNFGGDPGPGQAPPGFAPEIDVGGPPAPGADGGTRPPPPKYRSARDVLSSRDVIQIPGAGPRAGGVGSIRQPPADGAIGPGWETPGAPPGFAPEIDVGGPPAPGADGGTRPPPPKYRSARDGLSSRDVIRIPGAGPRAGGVGSIRQPPADGAIGPGWETPGDVDGTGSNARPVEPPPTYAMVGSAPDMPPSVNPDGGGPMPVEGGEAAPGDSKVDEAGPEAAREVDIANAGIARDIEVADAAAADASPDIKRAAPGVGEPREHESGRRPSATLALLMARQLQFLAMLSLIEYIVVEDSWLADFVIRLRWVHLWLPADAFRGAVPDSCRLEDDPSDLNVLVFLGNVIIVAVILLTILLVHITVISGVEAYWLVKARAKDDVRKARLAGSVQDASRAPLSGDGSPFKNAVAKCRERSASIWLHFPHVELSFLLFSFEGAVAAYLSALRHSQCMDFLIPSLIFLALYPLVLFITTGRTIYIRVQSAMPLEYKKKDESSDRPNGFVDFFRRMWKDGSLFSWADKGSWETVKTENPRLKKEWDWFRIGWEPVFADYTKRGTWFVMVLLCEGTSLACVGVLVDDSMTQLLLYGVIRLAVLVVLLWLRPYLNSVVNAMEAFSVAKDVFSLVLMGLSAKLWEGTAAARAINTCVAVLQVTSLLVMAVPVYVTDLPVAWSLAITEGRKIVTKGCCYCLCRRRHEGGDLEEKTNVSRIIRAYNCGEWCANWGTMMSENFVAFIKDTKEGFRRARVPAANGFQLAGGGGGEDDG